MSERYRCDAVVYRRDQMRVCRDGKRKFRMHYDRVQCKRAAVYIDKDACRCRQHRSTRFLSFPRAEKYMEPRDE